MKGRRIDAGRPDGVGFQRRGQASLLETLSKLG